LKTKGCNTYELVSNINEDGIWEDITIKQGFAGFSDQVYRP